MFTLVSFIVCVAAAVLATILMLAMFVLFQQERSTATAWTFVASVVSYGVAAVALLLAVWFAIVEAVGS